MVHVNEILPVRTPVHRRVPLNLHGCRNVKYVECRTTFKVDHLQSPARVLLLVVVPERNQLSIRRHRWPDRDALGDSLWRSAIYRYTPKVVRIVWISVLKHDPPAIRRKGGPRALSHVERQLLRTATVAIDSPDLKHTSAVRVKHDVTIVG